jgi:superfamily II DNA or RNA helicase
MALQFVVLIQEHPKLGFLFYPFFIQDEGKDYAEIVDRISTSNLTLYESQLTKSQYKIVTEIEEYNDQNLTKRFTNKNIAPRDFVLKLDKDTIEKFVRPFVEKQMAKCISIIAAEKINVFFRQSNNAVYLSDRVFVENEPAEIIFNFIKLPNETQYFQTVSHSGKVMNLTNKDAMIMTNEPCWLLLENHLYFFKDKVDGKKLRIFFNKEYILYPEKLEPQFYSTFVKGCIGNFPYEAIGFEVIEMETQKYPILSYEMDFTGIPVLVLRYNYDGKTIEPMQNRKVVVEYSATPAYQYRIYKRDEVWENGIIKILNDLGIVRRVEYSFQLADIGKENKPPDKFGLLGWLNANVEVLKSHGFEISQQFIDIEYFMGAITVVLSFTEKNDWFDVYAIAKFGDNFEIPIYKLRKYLLNGIREFLLPDGKIAILPEQWFEKFHDLVSFGEKDNQKIRVKKGQFAIIEQVFHGITTEIGKSIESFSTDKSLMQEELPGGLKATLRSYQAEGYFWLNFMRKQSLGVCLADDMGLGKTIQTLTLLLKVTQDQPRTAPQIGVEKHGQTSILAAEGVSEPTGLPSLVVMPASLIHNWENEIRKFTSGLKIINYTGSLRAELQPYFQSANIILTTYGAIRNDIDSLSKIEFEYIILDESQVIKNPSSKIALAVNKLNSRHKLAISGTPIENSLTDLWSQMNFLNRGLLGDLSFFKKYFALPIEKNNNEERRDKLHALIKPYILRRTKSEVEKELPELSEEYIYCEMSEQQREIYLAEKSRIRNHILESIELNGMEKSAIVILQGLTKLRQLANHPGLVEEEYTFDSGKFDEVIRNVETLISENHKVLMFSSFVKHLDLFASYFDENKIGYSRLTGETRHRAEVIEEFQTQDNRNVFLISIKAGGVGLNLTQAGYVFLLDPWWNPAVENQAVNRAHRIGQDKHVFAYRFITLDTIEEKIMRLQQKKSKLAEIFIHSDNPLNNLSVKNISELMD